LPTLKPKEILIAPLDWGLGHTARCIPIIRYIQSLGHVPVIAGNASQISFIKETFGAIDFIHIPGYDITYSAWNRFGQMGLVAQLPRLHRVISNEHQWVLEVAQNRHIDGIISDNRYGLFHPQIPSVIITHQLMVQSGLGKGVDRIIQKIHYKYLERFGNIWVVDNIGEPNLAGSLSHSAVLPKHAKYIGLLSRFEEWESKEHATGDGLLILISGPEPQRTDFSTMLWKQVHHYEGRVDFVEGSETAVVPTVIPPNIRYHKRLGESELAPLLAGAGLVICRSGYSTIMDLVALRKKAIIMPTPGQTEQIYLARYLQQQHIFLAAKQDQFQLGAALKEVRQFQPKLPILNESYTIYKQVLEEWLAAL